MPVPFFIVTDESIKHIHIKPLFLLSLIKKNTCILQGNHLFL